MSDLAREFASIVIAKYRSGHDVFGCGNAVRAKLAEQPERIARGVNEPHWAQVVLARAREVLGVAEEEATVDSDQKPGEYAVSFRYLPRSCEICGSLMLHYCPNFDCENAQVHAKAMHELNLQYGTQNSPVPPSSGEAELLEWDARQFMDDCGRDTAESVVNQAYHLGREAALREREELRELLAKRHNLTREHHWLAWEQEVRAWLEAHPDD